MGHERFTVAETAYLRNLDKDDLAGPCVAIHHQSAPVDHGDGTISMSLCAPVLIVSLYLGQQKEAAEKVARILNKHWDDE